MAAKLARKSAVSRAAVQNHESVTCPGEALRKHRAAILELAAKHGAWRVRVFGSVARNEDTPNSDIDLLIDMEPSRSLFDLAELYADVNELVGFPVQLVETDGLHPLLRDRILSEAIAI